MANSYLQFCVELDVDETKSKEVIAIRKSLQNWESLDVLDLLDDPTHSTFRSEAGRDFLSIVQDEGNLNFMAEIDPQSPEKMYVYAEEYGSVYSAAHFIKMLAANHLIIIKDCILLTWAETCSKPRPDEFGGGACAITPKEIIWQESANQWASNLFANKS